MPTQRAHKKVNTIHCIALRCRTEKRSDNQQNRLLGVKRKRSQNHDGIKALSAVEQQSCYWCGFVKRITVSPHLLGRKVFCVRVHFDALVVQLVGKWDRDILCVFFILAPLRPNDRIHFFPPAETYVMFSFQRPNAKRAKFAGNAYYIALLLIAGDVVALTCRI